MMLAERFSRNMGDIVKDLPEGLAGPLHILDPIVETALYVVLALVVLLIGLYALAYWLYNRRRRPETPPKVAVRSRGAIVEAIQEIRSGYAERKHYRTGCHALSSLMKTHIEEKTGLEIEEMTPGEIDLCLKKNAAGYFRQLSYLQFSRHNPKRDEFFDICEKSIQIAKASRRLKK